MKKLRYKSKNPKSVDKKTDNSNRREEILNEYITLAKTITTEKEARDLLQRDWGKKNVYVELFGEVAKIIKARGLIVR